MANSHSASFVKASSQYARILNDLGITNGNITIELWVYPTSAPTGTSYPNAYRYFVAKGDNGAHVNYEIYYFHDAGGYKLDAQRTKGGVGGQVARWSDTSELLALNTWHHLVLRYDGTNIKLFTAPQGGSHTERATAAASGNGSSGMPDAFSIGDGNDNSSSFAAAGAPMDGYLDEVRVWNTSRTTGELDSNFEVELVGNESGLVAYYKLNNAWSDGTANAFDLTAVNTPTFSTTVPFTGSVNVTATPSVLSATLSLPSRTIVTDQIISPSVLALTSSLPSRTVTTDVAISPSPLTATFTLPAVTILIADTTISASVLALTSSLSTRAIITDQLLTPSPLSSLFSLPSSTVTAVMNVSVAPSPLSLTASVPAATVSASVNLAPSPLALTSSRPASTVVTDQVLTPSPFTAAFSLPSASVSTIQNATLTPSPLSATFSLLAATAIGALWENQSRESAASFTNETRQSSSWTNQDRSLS